MNGEKTDWVEGKRKWIMALVGMVAPVLVAFGMKQAGVDTIVTAIGSLLPVGLAIVYFIFNEREKKITNGTTPKVETPAQGESTPDIGAPVRLPPNVDTMPPFDGEDTVLTPGQISAITNWYMLARNEGPVLPDKAIGSPNRVMEAKNAIAFQVISPTGAFKGGEFERVLLMRKDCDVVIERRVRFHYGEAKRRLVNYWLELWADKEGVALI